MEKKKVLFYKRSGERISREKVRNLKLEAAEHYEKGTFPIRNKNPRVAERIRNMSEEEFCRMSGIATYKVVRR